MRRIISIRSVWVAAAAAVLTAAPALTAQQAAQSRERSDESDAAHVRRAVGDAARGSRIGISIEEVEQGGDAPAEGAVVTGVADDSPASAAGFAEGDVVVRFAGERVRGVRQLSRLVGETPAGRTVPVEVVRGGDRVKLEVAPERREGRFGRRFHRLGRNLRAAVRGLRDGEMEDVEIEIERGPRRGRLGADVVGLSPQLADHYRVDAGVLVMTVPGDTAADAAGLRAGDVVTAIDDRPVAGVRDVRRRLAAVEPGRVFSIEVMRGGETLSLEAELDDPPPSRRRPGRRV